MEEIPGDVQMLAFLLNLWIISLEDERILSLLKIDYIIKLKQVVQKNKKIIERIVVLVVIYIYIIRKIAIDNNNKKKKNISGFIENV